MHSFLEQPVGVLVKENPARSRVFDKYRVDYCCGGKKILGKALDEKGIAHREVVDALTLADAGPAEFRLDRLSPAELTRQIQTTWHQPLREELPRLVALSAKVALRHGERWPFLVEIARRVEVLATDLQAHMQKEDSILFPWVCAREAGLDDNAAPEVDTVLAMIREHEEAGETLSALETLTQGFVPQAEACTSWRMLFAGLADLSANMHRHVHAENEILFPWVREALAVHGGVQ